ncbi:hypothetical protein F4824DRAFT_508474 [Ustulina deusta]|nr:hypothetical protein F4824DRAFT_508474 [Ustulina deusta]
MDPIEQLFRDLPSPAAEQSVLDQHGMLDSAQFCWVLKSFSPSGSCDPDREFVAKWARSLSKDRDYERARSELGRFALDKPQIPDDGSAKSQQLKYHAWISQGRKEEEYPFQSSTQDCSEGQGVDLPDGGHAFLPAKLTDPKICANCRQPDADAACGGCLVMLDSHVVMKTAYCSKTCQTQHWKEHKSQCLARRKVCRAVSLIYDLFIMFQQKAWIDKHVVSITEKHGIINVLHDKTDGWALQGKPFMCRFPSGMAPSEEHARAVLFDSDFQQLLSTCQGFVRLLLLPLCQTLQEVHIMPRNAYRPICLTRNNTADNTMYHPHVVLCATLESGEQVAVDIAGAQFGWRETVAPWGVWTSHRMAGKSCADPFGSSEYCMQTVYRLVAPQFVQVCESLRSSLAQKMQVAIQNKMKENKAPSAGELYKLDAAAFASCKLAILSSAEEALDNGLRKLYESKVGFCYIDVRGEWQATTTKQQAEALKGVWLTEEDVKMAKDEGTDLKIIYRLRCKNQGRQKFRAAGLNMP